jgi:hypothetical protein
MHMSIRHMFMQLQSIEQRNLSQRCTSGAHANTTLQQTRSLARGHRLRPLVLYAWDLARRRSSPRHQPRQVHLPPFTIPTVAVVLLFVNCAGFRVTLHQSASNNQIVTSWALAMMGATVSARCPCQVRSPMMLHSHMYTRHRMC